MASSLTRDFTATPTNAKKFTVSFWLKKTNFTSNQIMLCNYGNSGNDDFQIQLRNDDTLGILDYKGGGVNSNHETTRKFQDCNSWYHIVVQGDSTQSTASDRLKLYINGVQETEWASATNIGQNNDFNWNKIQKCRSIPLHLINSYLENPVFIAGIKQYFNRKHTDSMRMSKYGD